MSNQYQGLDRFYSQNFVDSFIYYRSLSLAYLLTSHQIQHHHRLLAVRQPHPQWKQHPQRRAQECQVSAPRWEASSYFRWKSKCSATRVAGAACSGSTATRATSRARASGRPRAGRATWRRSPRSPPSPAPPRAGTRGREVGTRNRTAGKIYHKCSNGFLPLCWMQK